jgi:nucleoside-diphosphate-sugar epimerase
VIGATGTIGHAVSAALKARHEVIEVGATRGQYRVDSTDPASIERLFRESGKVDGVVTAMGKVHFGPLPEMSVEQF